MNAALAAVLFFFQANAVFEIDMLPGEGGPVYEAASNELQLHALPSTASRILATIKVTAGQRLAYDDERYRTIQAGRIEALSASRIQGRLIGKVSRLSRNDYYNRNFASANIEVKSGAAVEFLQYRAEGSCFIRIAGDVIDAPCPYIDIAAFKLAKEPITEEWIHTTIGGSTGWLLASGPGIKEVDRTF